MGSVEAVAEELADGTTRVVALKRILRTSAADAPRLEMFLREARLTTLIEHPNVIRSFAYGESEGEVFLAMEYIAGESLSRVLAAAAERGEPLALPIIAHVLAEACDGLHAAHELAGEGGEPLGVVHRDVSPHNIMIGYDGTVKLLDFGVAKIELADSAARTKTGEVKGKTAYMSPEQAMGDPVDRRSDLYSIGAVLFECIVGRRLWGTGTDFEVLRRLALQEPPRLGEVAPATPAPVAALQARLVERDRAKRIATAREVATELRACGGGEVDSALVRAVMETLFHGERERREAAITRALSDSHHGSDVRPPPLARPSAGSGTNESTPAFVTHTSAASAPALGVRVIAALATVAALLAAFALRGTRPVAPTGERAPARSEAIAEPVKASESVPGSEPRAPTTAPAASAKGSAATVAPAPRLETARRARPTVGPASPAASLRSIPAVAPVTPTPAPPASTVPPPDVDPTPF